MTYTEILRQHAALKARKETTAAKFLAAQQAFAAENIQSDSICVYTVGSIGRDEIGSKSDLDLFFISRNGISRLEQHLVFAASINVNKNLGFEQFSNEGEFLKVHSL